MTSSPSPGRLIGAGVKFTGGCCGTPPEPTRVVCVAPAMRRISPAGAVPASPSDEGCSASQ